MFIPHLPHRYYYNREPGKPRFVTLVLYLNDEWGEELHAETLLVDPTAHAGLFVRPTPGRCVCASKEQILLGVWQH